MLKPLFHLTAFSINSYVILYDQLYVDIPFPFKGMENLPFKSRSMFLTMWCLALQTIYYMLALFDDIVESNWRTKKRPVILRKALDRLFALAFPLAMYTSIAFWALYSVDKEAILPDYVDNALPTFFNHVFHTTIAVFMLIELFMSPKDFPSRRSGFNVLLSFFLIYVTWYFYIYALTGGFPYPFFVRISWTIRSLFMISNAIIVCLLYAACEKLNDIVWTSPKPYKNISNKSKSS